MVAWIIYLCFIALLLTAAAWIAESTVRPHGLAGRGVWCCAMLTSVFIPLALLIFGDHGASSVRSATSSQAADKVSYELVASAATVPLSQSTTSAANPTDHYNSALAVAWIASSLIMLCALGLMHVHWFRRRTRWMRGTLDGVSLRISVDKGPAVVGLLSPEIVVPAWLCSASPEQRKNVLLHEMQHLQARDPQLLSIALIIVALMPWNPLLWLQLQKLRRAIEIDCDRRVLAAGGDRHQYAETLLAIAQHPRQLGDAFLAMSRPDSHLEERIRIMLKPTRPVRALSLLIAGLSLSLAALATQIDQPAPVNLGRDQLDRLVGFYRYADNAVVHVTRNGSALAVQFAGQRTPDALSAKGKARFAYPDSDAELQFEPGSSNEQAHWVRLLQNGATTEMPRLDEAQAKKIESERTLHLAQGKPAPGSEAALRELITGIQAGRVNLQRLNPQLAGALRKDWPRFREALAPLGALTALTFKATDENGFSSYEATHQHGTSEWSLTVDGTGVVTGATAPIAHLSQ